ncbi:MAG: endoflagellar filament sheath protein [bacterium]|nr:endoflagellar filament sheath protein [bacterium]
MKIRVKEAALSVVIGALVVFVGNGGIDLGAQPAGGGTAGGTTDPATTTTSSKKATDGLIEDWMNDFEACEDWRAEATCPIGDSKIRKIPGKPRPVNVDGKAVDEEGNPGDFKTDVTDDNGIGHKNEYVLGVKTYFLDRGFDRVEVFPPNEYIIRGKAREVRVWVLGRKFRHTLYVKLRDFKGHLHKLKIGRLDFWGWKEMVVIIPGWLPQSSSYAVLDKNLHFVSFFVESDKFEIPGAFYFYMDQFRVVTDLSEFTGDETIKDTW